MLRQNLKDTKQKKFPAALRKKYRYSEGIILRINQNRKNGESLYFGYAELCTSHSDTFVTRKELKFRMKASVTFDNFAY